MDKNVTNLAEMQKQNIEALRKFYEGIAILSGNMAQALDLIGAEGAGSETSAAAGATDTPSAASKSGRKKSDAARTASNTGNASTDAARKADAQPEPASPASASDQASDIPTLDDVRRAMALKLGELNKQGKQGDGVGALFQEFGVTRASELKPEDRQAYIDRLKDL